MKFTTLFIFFWLSVTFVNCEESICDILTKHPNDLQGTVPKGNTLYLILRDAAFSIPLHSTSLSHQISINEQTKLIGHWSQLPFLAKLPPEALVEMLATNKTPSRLLHIDGNDFIKADAAYQVVYHSKAKTLKRCKIFLSDNTPICDEDITSSVHYSFISSGNPKSTTGGFMLQESGQASRVNKLVYEDSKSFKKSRNFSLTDSFLEMSNSGSGKPYIFSLPVFGFIYESSQQKHVAHIMLPSKQVVFTFDNKLLQKDLNQIPVKTQSFANFFYCTKNGPKYPKIRPTVNLSNIALAGSKIFRNPLIIFGVVFVGAILLTGGCLLVQVTQGKSLPKKRNQTRFIEKHYVARHPIFKASGTLSSKSSSKSTRPTTTNTKRSKRKLAKSVK